MKTAARLRGAIEILQMIILDGMIPEKAITSWGRPHKFAGSSDRRFISDIVYDVIRNLGTLSYYIGGKTPHLLVAGWLFFIKHQNISDIFILFSGERHEPAILSDNEQKIFLSPKKTSMDFEFRYNMHHSQKDLWYDNWGSDSDKLLHKFNVRAPLDLRVNLTLENRDEVISVLKNDFPRLDFSLTPYSDTGIRTIDGHFSLRDYKYFNDGIIDIQDESSQLISQIIASLHFNRLLDYCAGGGGKALTISIHRNNQIELIASDISEKRLAALKERSIRSKLPVRIIAAHRLSPKNGLFDCVLADVPCSGSGTWRRNVYEKISTSYDDIVKYSQKQIEILNEAEKFVSNNGYLIYTTCSLFKLENQNVIEKFLLENPYYQLVTDFKKSDILIKTDFGFYLTPYHHNTDGFFIAILRKDM